ncbi:MAG: hypothetical protein J6K31_06875 [Parabacteroides sp.]|nr:hypothetical protein [Parabacteroides sp.]
MNFKKYAIVLGAIALCTGFYSCDDDEIEDIDKPADTVITSDFYVLNRGNDGANNASIAYYNATSGMLNDKFYEDANGSGLGDSAEDMLVYGSKMYVSVTSSNRLAVMDMSGKLMKAIEPENEGGEPLRPRYLAADKGKIYMSYFYGHSVAVLDTASLEVEKVIPVGRYPEQIVVSNNKLYVANSGGNDYPNYGKTVSVLDLSSLEVEKEIEVVINPCRLEANNNGDVYVISMGNYGDIPNTLQCIDGKTGAVKTLGNGSRMDLRDGFLYVLYAQWGQEESIHVSKYDALTGELVNDNLVPDINKVSTLSSINVDASGNIYITDAPYTETGSVYVFNKDGKGVSGSPVDSKGYGPNTVWVKGN